ncbi:TadA family conjugal transfer-associated ATPase [Phycicoccus sp.]|uniref:TadA family conjugal transfer-associated ATPase n=1 Tax=Phycicoccus sp. TaxID=1902410 RepID=UPI002D1B8BC6|nr:TadA family conjugal transfer-associated ATPase [Phycicoccus sp.]HMM95621.1 TadA family conjugal transfer-associated ATPase [Phycicoccus sp.]
MSRVPTSPRPAGVERAIRAGEGPSPARIARVARESTLYLGPTAGDRAAHDLTTGLVGLGPLAGLVEDPEVTDVLVNGDGSVWVERGAGVEPAGPALDPSALRPLAVRLAGLAGRRLDDAQPWVDGLLPSGVRLHAVLPPLVEHGPHLSLRVPRRRLAGCAALVEHGMCSPGTATVLRGLVAARRSLLVTGGTGAGKTTLLGALLAECPPEERLVVVEDVRELDPDHPHVVRLQGRAANVEGVGEVPLSVLVRQALRMRPDRLVVGEVRGGEVRDLLAALNTGHEGGAGTLHANGPGEVPARLEALGSLVGMPRAAVHAQLKGALQAVVHVVRDGRGRHVDRVGVLRVGPDGLVEVPVALTDRPDGPVPGEAWAALGTLLPGAGAPAGTVPGEAWAALGTLLPGAGPPAGRVPS